MRHSSFTSSFTSPLTDPAPSGFVPFRLFRRFDRDASRTRYWSSPAGEVVDELTIIADRLRP